MKLLHSSLLVLGVFITSVASNTVAAALPPCPGVSISFPGVSTSYCLESTVDYPLTAVVTNNNSGSLTWTGLGVTGTNFSPATAGAGQHWIKLNYEEVNGCTVDDSIRVEVYQIQATNIVVDPREICAGDTAQIRYSGNLPPGAIYNWTFEAGSPLTGLNNDTVSVSWDTPGNYAINLTITGAGCTDSVVVNSGLMRVSEPIPSANLSCGDFTLNSVIFEWDQVPDVVAYRYRLLNQTPVFTSSTSLSLSGLLPGDSVLLQVTPLGSSACGNGPTDSVYCRTMDCPNFTIDFSDIPTTLCLDSSSAPIPLVPVVMGGSGINSSQTWTGPGIQQDTFFPALVGPGNYWLTLNYQEKGPCGIVDSILINVYRVEAGDFELDPNQICFGDTATVNYIGGAAADAIFEWSFGSVDTIGNDLRGDIQLTFPAPGFYPIELTVTELGCRTFATTFLDSIRVVAPLVAVEPRCGTVNRNEIRFEWDSQPTATAYLLQQPGGNPFARETTFYQLASLEPGTEHTLVVTPLGQFPCGDGPPDTISCMTEPCPVIVLDLTGIPTEFCNYRDVETITLVATQLGGNGDNATFLWSGNGVIANTFDPQLAGPGEHLIRVDYTETGICTAKDSLLIQVFPVPEADLVINRSELCLRDSTEISFAGVAGPNATYNWDFDGGTVISGAGQGPYLVSWPEPGTYDINVVVSENNCTSLENGQLDIVSVLSPLEDITLSCGDRSLTTLNFSWPDLPDVEAYRVSRIGHNDESIIQQNNQVFISGLQPGEAVELVVVPLAVNLCGDGGADTISCVTEACPPLAFSFPSFTQEFCFGEGPSLVNLPTDFTNGDARGTFNWSGAGVNFDGTTYSFSPLLAGVGTSRITANYYLRDSLDFTGARLCAIDSSVLMSVYPEPSANAGPDQVITCQRREVTLSGAESSSLDAITYNWTVGEPAVILGSANTQAIETASAGTYTLIVSTARGCIDSDQVTVTISTTPPVPELELFDVSCFGEANGIISVINFEGGVGPYQLVVDGFPVNGTYLTDLTAGQYELEVIDAENCSTRQLVTLTQPDQLAVRIFSSSDLSAIPIGTTVNLVADITGGNPIDSIYWLPEGLGIASFNRLTLDVFEERNIEINVIDESGCRAADQISLITTLPDPLFIPTGFSPNGDNVNDLFVIGANPEQVTEIEEFAVFDRWGAKVFGMSNFPPNDPRFGWDGTAQGNRLNSAVFVYYAIVVLTTGERVTMAGGITLVK